MKAPPIQHHLYGLLLCFLLFSFNGLSQEICDNGIDDDNDGLVDLNDTTDCSCNLYTTTPLSLIPNPSFEDTLCCPTGSAQLNCANNWVQASDATSDYFNLCGYSNSITPPDTPLPGNGSGFTGIINDAAYTEYIGACLNSPMIAGTSYTLNFYTAMSSGSFNFDFSLFGTSTCSDLPWSGYSCPVGNGQWQELAAQNISYSTEGAWQLVSLTFTPNVDIHAVALGGGCGTQSDGSFNYYYIDELYLDSTENFGAWIMGNGGNLCENDLVLTASTVETGGSWQWYQDGVALPGETGSSLDISTYGPGNYSAIYSNSDGCVNANATFFEILYPDADFTLVPDICTGMVSLTDQSTISGGGIANVDWYFSDNTQAPDVFDTIHLFDTPGTYDITQIVTSAYGCTDTSTQSISFDFNMNVDIQSTVDATVYQASFGDTINFCFNENILLNEVSYVTSPETIVDYEWTFDFNPNTTVNAQDTAHQFPTPGHHNVLLTITASNGCVKSISQPVWIHEVPEASFVLSDGTQSYQSISNDTLHFCTGDTLYFFNTSTFGILDSISGYGWTFGNGQTYFSEDTLLTYPNAGIYDVVLNVATDYFCNDEDSLVLVMNETHANIVEINYETCTGAADGSAIIADFLGAYDGIYTVHFFDPDSNLVSTTTLNTGDSLHLPNLYTGVWSLSVDNNYGCPWSTNFTIQSIDPPINISTNLGHPQCYGTTTGSITAFSTNSGNFSFDITDSDGNLVNAPNTNTANSLGAGTYTISIIDNNNCYTAIDVQLIDPLAIDVVLNLTHPLCHGLETGSAVVDTIFNAQGSYHEIDYNWDPNPNGSNGLLETSNTGLIAGEYILEITDAIGCSKRTTFHILDPNPLIGVLEVVSPTYCRTAGYQQGNGEVTATTAGLNFSGTGNVSYHWENLENGDESDYSTFVVNVPGLMAVILEDDNGCIFTDTILVDSINPIADFDLISDQFEGPGQFEGTELMDIQLINQSLNFAKASYVLSDTIFKINWFANAPSNADGQWFFSHDYTEKIDTSLTGEQDYLVCLVAKNFNSCTDTLCRLVEVHAIPELDIPNVFTPGTAPNNVFFFPNRGIETFEATVFNRYGVPVYTFKSIDDYWDGLNQTNDTPCVEGVYFYTYRAVSSNGTHFSGQGNVHLIRAK